MRARSVVADAQSARLVRRPSFSSPIDRKVGRSERPRSSRAIHRSRRDDRLDERLHPRPIRSAAPATCLPSRRPRASTSRSTCAARRPPGDRAVLAAVSTPNGWPNRRSQTHGKIAPKAGDPEPGQGGHLGSPAPRRRARQGHLGGDEYGRRAAARTAWLVGEGDVRRADARHAAAGRPPTASRSSRRAKAAAAPPPPPPSTATSTLSKSMRRDLGSASPPPVAGAPRARRRGRRSGRPTSRRASRSQTRHRGPRHRR